MAADEGAILAGPVGPHCHRSMAVSGARRRQAPPRHTAARAARSFCSGRVVRRAWEKGEATWLRKRIVTALYEANKPNVTFSLTQARTSKIIGNTCGRRKEWRGCRKATRVAARQPKPESKG